MHNYLTISCLLLLGLLLSTPALAKIYTWTDADGKTVFSDQPKDGATEVQLAPTQTWSGADIKATRPALRPSKKTPPQAHYRLLAITQPIHDQALRAANGQVDIMLAIEPALATVKGHYIRIQLDGKTIIDNNKNNRLSLSDIDRGSHQLSATIHDRNGNLLSRSDSVTFHLHRQSLLHKKPGPAP